MMQLLNSNCLLCQRLTGRFINNSLISKFIREESHLSSLRKKTGYALNLCKQALDANKNDVGAAEKWLKEQAATHGWAKATKLQGRSSAEGLVGVLINESSNKCLAIELNCETDFVARNDIFRSLTASLVKTIASSDLVKSQTENQHVELVKRFTFNQEQLEPFKKHIVESISQLSENLVLKRAVAMTANSNEGIKLTGYAHSVGGVSNRLDEIYLGKYGSVVAYANSAEEDLPYEKEWLLQKQTLNKRSREAQEMKNKKEKEEAIKTAGEGEDPDDIQVQVDESLDTSILSQYQAAKAICQQIIAYKASKLRYDSVELEHLLKLAKLRLESGASAFSDDDDFEALLEQNFILDGKITVREFLQKSNLRVVDFLTIECGKTTD